MQNKKIISNFMIWFGIFLIITHAIYKLYSAQWMDWQHWGVLFAGIMIVIGSIIRGMR